MNWIRIVLINIVVLLSLLILISLGLRSWDAYKEKESEQGMFDTNTIRATYPNYALYDKADAISIFADYEAAGTTYTPFVGWRRNIYSGRSVNVEPPYNTRLSFNQKIEHSFWFFGGSTMWGVGAQDNQTIPSYFAKASKQSVWNLGEPAINSFQELIQLQVLLVNDLMPKVAIFYDGVNDGFYCNANATKLPNHMKEEKYRQRINEHRTPSEIIKKLREKEGLIFFAKEIFYFFIDPYQKRFTIFDKQVVARKASKDLSTSRPFSTFKKENKYHICGTDSDRAEKAARITINTWFLVHDVLSAKGIPVLFVLQPAAYIGTEFHQLDYILDSEKQRLVDEKSSYEAFYAMIKKIWFSECQQRNICESFLDLSNVFNNYNEPIYVDTFHLSPNGNKIVAEEIFDYMCSKEQYKVCQGE